MSANCFPVVRFMKCSICNAKASSHLLYCKMNVWQEAKWAVCGFRSLHAQCGTSWQFFSHLSWSVCSNLYRGTTSWATSDPRAMFSWLPVAIRLLQLSCKAEPRGSLAAVAINTNCIYWSSGLSLSWWLWVLPGKHAFPLFPSGYREVS